MGVIKYICDSKNGSFLHFRKGVLTQCKKYYFTLSY